MLRMGYYYRQQCHDETLSEKAEKARRKSTGRSQRSCDAKAETVLRRSARFAASNGTCTQEVSAYATALVVNRFPSQRRFCSDSPHSYSLAWAGGVPIGNMQPRMTSGAFDFH